MRDWSRGRKRYPRGAHGFVNWVIGSANKNRVLSLGSFEAHFRLRQSRFFQVKNIFQTFSTISNDHHYHCRSAFTFFQDSVEFHQTSQVDVDFCNRRSTPGASDSNMERIHVRNLKPSRTRTLIIFPVFENWRSRGWLRPHIEIQLKFFKISYQLCLHTRGGAYESIPPPQFQRTPGGSWSTPRLN